MKFLKNLLLFSGLALLAFSCTKDDDDTGQPAPVTAPNYSQLKVGNYWIYQRFQIDNGTVTPLNVYDSVYVEKDSVINGNRYYFLNYPSIYHGYTESRWVRDSLHYVVTSTGGVDFSSEDFTNEFNHYYQIINAGADTVYWTVDQMTDQNLAVATPAGNFVTSNMRTKIVSYTYNDSAIVRYEHRRFAKNVGIVLENLPEYLLNLQNGRWKERRLVRYHVQ